MMENDAASASKFKVIQHNCPIYSLLNSNCTVVLYYRCLVILININLSHVVTITKRQSHKVLAKIGHMREQTPV